MVATRSNRFMTALIAASAGHETHDRRAYWTINFCQIFFPVESPTLLSTPVTIESQVRWSFFSSFDLHVQFNFISQGEHQTLSFDQPASRSFASWREEQESSPLIAAAINSTKLRINSLARLGSANILTFLFSVGTRGTYKCRWTFGR